MISNSVATGVTFVNCTEVKGNEGSTKSAVIMCVKIVLSLANDLILLTLLIVSIKKEKAPIKYSWKRSQTFSEKGEIGI